MSRLPQYEHGSGEVLYHGELLPNVTTNKAFEYMLSCIPALHDFHITRDDVSRENIFAMAVILRQFEEMDDNIEDESDQETGQASSNHEDISHRGLSPGLAPVVTVTSEKVNFLAIIKTVVESPCSRTLLLGNGLFNAAYWMALRQEVYYALTRGRSPQMLPSAEQWLQATPVNKVIAHTAQVASWLRDDQSDHEWCKSFEFHKLLQ